MSTMPFIQPAIKPLPANLDVSGQTIIITGASSGLGYEFSRQYLIRGASTIILAVRDVSKGEKTKASLKADADVAKATKTPDIRVMQFDAASYDSVKKFIARVNADLKQLHILMLNAGANGVTFEKTADGHEQTVQVNHLANAAVLFGLLPLLEATAAQTGKPTRVSITGSRMYDTGPLCKEPAASMPRDILQYLDDPKKYTGFSRYADSKLLVLLFMHRLGKLYGSEKVVINNFCPGMVDTPMTKNLPWYLRAPVALLASVRRARPVEQGGWVGLNAAVVAGAESHGQLIGDTELERIDGFYNGEGIKVLEEALWKDTVKDVSKVTDVPAWAVVE